MVEIFDELFHGVFIAQSRGELPFVLLEVVLLFFDFLLEILLADD